MNRERMDAALELVCQRRVDHAVPFEPALPRKGGRYNIESEMSFAARLVAGVSLMQTGFVFDVQAFRRESRNELGRYDVLYSHRHIRSEWLGQ